MRALFLASSLTVVAAFVTASCDLFHSTDWPTLCDLNADAVACGGGAGGAASSSSHTTTSTQTSSSTHMMTTSTGQGAGGSGGSGTIDCAQYCAEVTGACSGADEQYASEPECEQICGALPMTPGASNTAACRANIADALAQNPSKCSSAGPAGQPACGGTCDAYCYLMHFHCPAEFSGIMDCGLQCPHFGADPASYDDSQRSGATTACHLYWATQAVLDPANCANAGVASPVCGGTGGGGGAGGGGAGGSGVGGS